MKAQGIVEVGRDILVATGAYRIPTECALAKNKQRDISAGVQRKLQTIDATRLPSK